MLAHNLMTSSGGTSSDDSRRTDGVNGRRTDTTDEQRTDQTEQGGASQNGQPNTQSLIRQLLSNNNSVNPQEFQFNGSTYRRCPMHKRVTFNLNNADLNNVTNDFSISLIDRGCNGGFLGEDARILSIKDNYFADVIGMNNSKFPKLQLAQGA